MGLQRPRVAQPAAKSSPGIFTQWPCPERILKRSRPGVLFPSKAPMEGESACWREMESGGAGLEGGGNGRHSFLQGWNVPKGG